MRMKKNEKNTIDWNWMRLKLNENEKKKKILNEKQDFSRELRNL